MNSASKHIGPFLAFDLTWFTRHQRALLWLLNTPVVRGWFRWVLCVSHRGRITEIRPNSISYGDRLVFDKEWQPRLQRATEFRTHWKYAKRIYYAFRPLWWALHWWDELVADQWLAELSFGFDSLTAYPAAGANSPVDGIVWRGTVNETFATLSSGAGQGFSDTSTALQAFLSGAATTNQFSFLQRGIMCFDTSALGGSATISAVTFNGYGSFKSNSLGSDDVHVCASTPASTGGLANSDYGQLGSTSFASMSYASFSNGVYNTFTLNSNGISNVSKTGISKFGWRLGWDITGTFGGSWVNGQNTAMYVRSADQTGTSEDPYLTVTYTVVTETYPAGYFPGELRNHPLVRM